MTKKYSSRPGIISILTLDRLGLTERAVNSILKNSSEDVKMVFLDNGSKDKTLEYLGDLKSQYPANVKVLQSPINLGVAGGRNEILKDVIKAQGYDFNWVLNLDNDCLVHKGYDEAITHAIQEESADVVCPKLIQPDGSPFYNANMGFMIDLKNKKLKLEYETSEQGTPQKRSGISRLETDVILGTSAKTPRYIKNVGF